MNTRTEYRYSLLAAAVDLTMASDESVRTLVSDPAYADIVVRGETSLAALYAATTGQTWESLAERFGDDGFGVVGAEIDAAFARITLDGRMADAGQTGVV